MGEPARRGSVRVALDAMGGDHAPDAVVDGALRAQGEGVEIVLVGRPDDIAAALARLGAPGALPVATASEVVGMDEDAAFALRTKRDASIRVAAQLVASGDADALVSAGATGGTLAAALLVLGRLPGVRRPAVGALIPSRDGGRVVLVDAGGSPDAQPEALLGYARMGMAYAEVLGEAPRPPRVGLLNVGAEAGKGNALAKAAHELLEGLPGFAGNVEPGGVLEGLVDVVVTDGFTGNIFLKTAEAVSGGYRDSAALVLGVAGEVLVAHGAAGAEEVADAVRMAVEASAAGLSGKVASHLARGEGDR
jgi:glycerol-3-phosphate acyltransferase PlsX